MYILQRGAQDHEYNVHLIAAAVTVVAFGAPASSETLRVGMECTFAPFNYKTETGELQPKADPISRSLCLRSARRSGGKRPDGTAASGGKAAVRGVTLIWSQARIICSMKPRCSMRPTIKNYRQGVLSDTTEP